MSVTLFMKVTYYKVSNFRVTNLHSYKLTYLQKFVHSKKYVCIDKTSDRVY